MELERIIHYQQLLIKLTIIGAIDANLKKQLLEYIFDHLISIYCTNNSQSSNIWSGNSTLCVYAPSQSQLSYAPLQVLGVQAPLSPSCLISGHIST